MCSAPRLRSPLRVIKRNSRRTLILALLACATLVWSAINSFDVPVEEMAWLAFYSFLGVFSIIVAAALFVALLQSFRWLLRGGWREQVDEEDQGRGSS